MEKRIYCEICGRRIRSNEDLVTAFDFIFLKPFHHSCYSKSLKGFRTIVLANSPVNAILFKIIGYILIPFSLLAAYSGQVPLAIISLLPFALVMLSWFLYEQHLPE